MLVSIVGKDIENSRDGRTAARPAHLARLQELADAGRLIVAGPNPLDPAGGVEAGFSGSVVIAEFDSLEQAQDWANADPYVDAGVYASVDVKPFKRVF